MNEELNILFRASPALLLVIALNVIGLGLKKVPQVPNWVIPLSLPLVGAIIYPFIGAMVPIPGIESLKNPCVLYGVIGAICGGVAVWGHQVVTKWCGRKNGASGDTETITK